MLEETGALTLVVATIEIRLSSIFFSFFYLSGYMYGYWTYYIIFGIAAMLC
jgi:hypothetical protein